MGEALARPLIPACPPADEILVRGFQARTPPSSTAWLGERGQPAYRARQLADHLWCGFCERRRRPAHTAAGTAQAARRTNFRVDTIVETEVRAADDGLTEKALHRLDDGRLVELVLMRYPARGWRRGRATVCISSQAGCAVACPFCATGELGFMRDLETAEIVDQVRFWQRRLTAEERHVTNVVFMGMGEPLLNTDAVIEAAAALTRPEALRPWRAPHHDQHERRAAGHGAADRAAAAVHARRLAAQRAAGAARRAGATQPALPGGRRRRRRRPLRRKPAGASPTSA